MIGHELTVNVTDIEDSRILIQVGLSPKTVDFMCSHHHEDTSKHIAPRHNIHRLVKPHSQQS